MYFEISELRYGNICMKSKAGFKREEKIKGPHTYMCGLALHLSMSCQYFSAF